MAVSHPTTAAVENSAPSLGALLKPSEVCQLLGVSRSWLYAAAHDGRIPSVRLGGPHGPLRFVRDDVGAWLEEARTAWRPTLSASATLRSVAAAHR